MTVRAAGTEIVKLASGRSVGVQVYGVEPGRGVPVLALHGAPASRLMFDVTDKAARDLGLTLYCPDRPGYGLTPYDGGAPLGARADELLDVATALGLENFAVLAISGGGPYGVALAARHPDRVNALSLVNPVGPVRDLIGHSPTKSEGGANSGLTPARMSAWHRWFFLTLPGQKRLLALLARMAELGVHYTPRVIVRLFGMALGKNDNSVLRQPEVFASFLAMTREALRQGMQAGQADLQIYSKSWDVDYAGITAPTQLWQGTSDRLVPPEAAYYLVRQIEGCRLTRLEGEGHFWVYNRIHDVLAALRAHLPSSD